MKKINLIWICMILLASLVLAEDVYVEVSLHLTPNDIIATNVQLYEGLPQDYVKDNNEYYVGKIYSFGEDLLYEFNFEKSFFVYDLDIELEESDETITFPHFRNMNKLEVWDGREIKLELDLSNYATCNENYFCDSFENERTCPEDCREEIVVEEIIEQKEESLPIKEKTNGQYYALIIVILVIFMVLFFLIVSRKKQKHF